MRKILKRTSLIILSVIMIIGIVSSIAWANQGKTKIIATTSLISCISKEVGKDKVSVSTILPPAACPGHFDLKIQDIQFLAESKAVFYHGWEGFMPKLMAAAPGKEAALKKISVEGNWMIPSKQKEAALAIAQQLGKIDPPNKSYYQKNALQYNKKVDRVASKLQAKTSRLRGQAVLGSALQKDFFLWLGLKPVGMYGRAEDITPQQTINLVEKGRKEKAHLVIDNLQSGPGAGKAIAKELDIKEVTLSNFPGGFSGTSTYLQTLEKNVALILASWK